MAMSRTRAMAWAAAVLAAGLLSALLWRGLNERPGTGIPLEFTWREAGDADLF